ncbi:unnamed protein product [Paramecium octaurelia]|uniref:Uncharacterized protein n=1 Tax=Paramecium octaurelia TaxID=43137 RepID=A0A8S1U7P8_PAROT|nr:unnamed protein product [Paramecium octaurelia]
MWEYVIAISSCLLILICIIISFLRVFKKKKVQYYSDPDEMAIELYQNMLKYDTKHQIALIMNKIYILVLRDVQIILYQFKLGQNDTTLPIISERLRNSSKVIALLKLMYPDEIPEKFKLVGEKIYENFTIFKILIQWCEQNEIKIKNSKGWMNSQLDINLINSIRAYSEYINNELGIYFKPK